MSLVHLELYLIYYLYMSEFSKKHITLLAEI